MIILTVYCINNHVVGTWHDTIEEKYPFWCNQCDSDNGEGDLREGKYPWRLVATSDDAA